MAFTQSPSLSNNLKILTNYSGLHNFWQPGSEKMEGEWENEEEIEREWGNFLIFSLFPPSLTLSYIKNCLILTQNVKYATFVANVTKNSTHARWENNSRGRIRCEKVPQVVPACHNIYYKHAPDHVICNISMPLICVLAVHHPLLSNWAIISFTVNRRKKCLRPYVNCLLC